MVKQITANYTCLLMIGGKIKSAFIQFFISAIAKTGHTFHFTMKIMKLGVDLTIYGISQLSNAFQVHMRYIPLFLNIQRNRTNETGLVLIGQSLVFKLLV